MSHLHYTVKSYHLQWNVRQLCQICHHFYQNYCPDFFKHRLTSLIVETMT